MKDDLGLNTKKAMQELLLALEHEHPEVLKGSGSLLQFCGNVHIIRVFVMCCIFR